MDFEAYFKGELDAVREEGRYRVFTEIERHCGSYPHATRYVGDKTQDVTVWCSNDYLGMGQHRKVLDAMHKVLDECGAGAGGGSGSDLTGAAGLSPGSSRASPRPTAWWGWPCPCGQIRDWGWRAIRPSAPCAGFR